MACGDPKARFLAVILDPELAQTAPRQVVAATGLDALSHALESYVTKARNPFSQMFAKQAFGLLDEDLENVLTGRADTEAWGRMLLGAHFAGAAIETSMLGAAHATANPLTAAFDITHGVAVALMLPATLRFNGAVVGPIYSSLRGDLDNGTGSAKEPWTPYRMMAAFTEAGIPKEVFALYPGGPEAGAAVLAASERAMIFGGTATVEQYRGNPRVQAHGPGFSKILLADDVVDDWEKYLDLMVESIYINSGRGCINCSGVWASRHTKEIAQAIAEKIGPIEVKPPTDPEAGLAAFTVPGMGKAVWGQRQRHGRGERGGRGLSSLPRLGCESVHGIRCEPGRRPQWRGSCARPRELRAPPGHHV